MTAETDVTEVGFVVTERWSSASSADEVCDVPEQSSPPPDTDELESARCQPPVFLTTRASPMVRMARPILSLILSAGSTSASSSVSSISSLSSCASTVNLSASTVNLSARDCLSWRASLNSMAPSTWL